jgi:uncharacterized protein YfaS (alpha-2-macroglobulin family)
VAIPREYGALQSDTRTLAMVLRAFVAAEPDHPLIPRLARGVLEGRINGRFRNTHEAAWALLALAAVRDREGPARTAGARVFLGDALVRDVALEGRPVALGIPMRALLEAGGSPLTFAQTGSGTLHYQARLRFARAGLPAEAEESGMFLRRSERGLDGANLPAGTFLAGSMVAVELTLVTPSPRRFVMIESPLPGGFEPAEDELRQGRAWLSDLERTRGRREVRDDRVVYFLDDLPAGVTTLRYVVRATTPGTFVLPPARAEEMYAPETFARTAAGTTIVAAR